MEISTWALPSVMSGKIKTSGVHCCDSGFVGRGRKSRQCSRLPSWSSIRNSPSLHGWGAIEERFDEKHSTADWRDLLVKGADAPPCSQDGSCVQNCCCQAQCEDQLKFRLLCISRVNSRFDLNCLPFLWIRFVVCTFVAQNRLVS